MTPVPVRLQTEAGFAVPEICCSTMDSGGSDPAMQCYSSPRC